MKKKFNLSLMLVGGCLFTAYSIGVYAQQTPDGGVILRELEKPELEQMRLQPEPYEIKKDKEQIKGQVFFVREFRFIGAELFSTVELRKLLRNFVGRNIGIAELNTAVSLVENYCAKKGYVVKVLIPEQEVKDNIVEMKIIIGRLDGYNISKKKTRFSQAIATKILNNAQSDRKTINIVGLERGLLLLNDLPGVKVTSSLRPSTAEGGVLVDLDIKDKPLVSSSVSYDNYGLHATGVNRGTMGLSLNDPFGIGDQINGSFVYTGLMDYESLAYSLPLGYSGMRAGLTASRLGYRLGKDFSYTNGKGNAYTVGSYVYYPLIRSREENLHLFASINHKKFTNDLFEKAVSDKKVDIGNIYINADVFDQFFGGGYTVGGLGFTLGNLNLKGNQSDYAADQVGRKANGCFSKLTFLVSRLQQVVAGETLLSLKVNGQVAFRNLDSSEQFSLGGPDAVRAYSYGDASGDHGVVANFELSQQLLRGVKISGFYDIGYVVQHYKTYPGWKTTANQKNSYALDAVGVSLGWTPSKWLAAKVSAATTATQYNSDLKLNNDFSAKIGRHSRIMLQATLAF